MKTFIWRFISGPDCNAAENMAIDEAIYSALCRGLCPPTVRLYEWQRQAISLGRYEFSTVLDGDACRELGLEIVRRLTGGGAVLHGSAPSISVFARKSGAYEKFKTALVELVERAHVSAPESSGPSNCAAPDGAAAGLELQIGETRKGDHAMLQGSVLQRRDREVLNAAMGRFWEDASDDEATCEEFSEGFEGLRFLALNEVAKKLGIQLVESKLDDFEMALAAELIPKYADERWVYQDVQMDEGELLAG